MINAWKQNQNHKNNLQSEVGRLGPSFLGYEKKGEHLTQAYEQSPYTNTNVNIANGQHKNAIQMSIT